MCPIHRTVNVPPWYPARQLVGRIPASARYKHRLECTQDTPAKAGHAKVLHNNEIYEDVSEE